MTVDVAALGPGDVIVTLEGKLPVSHLIRLGAWLTRQPAPVDHVIGVHHYGAPPWDPGMSPRWWGIEGRPGGVGWRDLTKVLDRRSAWANTGQLAHEAARQMVAGKHVGKTVGEVEQELRFLLATYFARLEKVPYDWEAIAAHARIASRLNHIRRLPEWRDGEFPGQVVCSSAMDGAYEYLHLANPGGHEVTRLTSPAGWFRHNTGTEWWPRS